MFATPNVYFFKFSIVHVEPNVTTNVKGKII